MERDQAPLSLTVTRTILLQGLASPGNRTVWHQFVDRYRPLIMRYAQKRFGLSLHDAEEAAQNTLAAFADAYRRGKYDREKGRLRHWLFGIATRQIKSLRRNRAKARDVQIPNASSGTGYFDAIPHDDARLEEMWEEEWQQAVYRQCMVEVRGRFEPKTVRAFEMLAQEGLEAKVIAEKLGMTENAVYLAKCKILKRIRELIPVIEDEW